MPETRRLITGKMNPYQNTIEQAMEKLGAIESAIRGSVDKKLQVNARVQAATRRYMQKGYAANADSVGLHMQTRAGVDNLLKRITLTIDIGTTAILIFVGRQDALGLREVILPAQLTAVTFANGQTGFSYSDAFNNDIFVRAESDIYIQVSGAATSHTIVATLETEECMPHNFQMTEDERLARAVAPQDRQDVADIDQTSLTVDPDEVERHTNPDTLEDMEANALYVEGSEPNEDDGRMLIPNASAHLPPHLQA